MQQLTEEQRKELEEKLKNMSPEELKEFQKQQCIFCQIIAGKVPAKKIYEDDSSMAILDINPAARGHILLLPKEHYSIMPQVAPKEMSRMFVIAKQLSKVLLKSLKADGTNIFIANGLAAGQRAQHFMLHVIPRKTGDNLLELQEKLVNEEMVNKVKLAIEQKLNQVLGIKKEIVAGNVAKDITKNITKSVTKKPEGIVQKIAFEKEAEEKELEKNEFKETESKINEDENNEDVNHEDKGDEDKNVEDKSTEDISAGEKTQEKSGSKPLERGNESKSKIEIKTETKTKKGKDNNKSEGKKKSNRRDNKEKIDTGKKDKEENDDEASLDDIANLFR